MNEKLSAFMDNELSELEERQLLKEMARNKELRETWERGHIIGAALRRESTGVAAGNDVRERVMQALGSETPKTAVRRAAKMLSVAGLGKAVGGFAIAASVATVAIVSIRPSMDPQTEVAVVTPATTVAANASTMTLTEKQKVAAQQLATMDPLNSYLVEHNEYASPFRGIGGVLPDVRTVDFDRNPAQ